MTNIITSRLDTEGPFEEPSDALHPLVAGVPVHDQKLLPPDVGDADAGRAGATDTSSTLHARKRAGATSGLNADQRKKARELVARAARLCLRHAAEIHYTMGARRWEGIDKGLRAYRGEFPRYGDCSSLATWLLWQGLGHFHVSDIVNGARWTAGYTGTMASRGKRIAKPENYKVGDAVLYGNGPIPGHVAIYLGGGKVFSHGSEPGPYLLDLRYRSDVHSVRRYI